MPVKMSKTLKDKILGEVTIGDDSPFEREGEKTYIKHDRITIENNANGVGATVVFWLGEQAHVFEQIDARIADDRSITIAGITGRQRVSIAY